MKVACVYTSTTPELIELLEQKLAQELAGQEYQVLSYQNPAILQNARDNGGVTPWCTRELCSLFWQAAEDGADVILNVCSSVGDIAKLAQPLYEMMGVSFVRIDEAMACSAVNAVRRIGVVATLPTTLEPTKRLVQDCAAALGKDVVVVDALAEGAFGLDQEQFKAKLLETGKKVADQVDALVFAQGSMAYAEEAVSQALGMPVYSSIRFGTADIKKALKKKGLLK